MVSGNCAGYMSIYLLTKLTITGTILLLTDPVGVRGGELKVGVGSRVESAVTPVSPRNSSPRLLDLRRRGRDIFIGLLIQN